MNPRRTSQIGCCLAFALLVLTTGLPPIALATSPGPKAAVAHAHKKREREANKALQALQELGLNRAQAKRLLPIVEQGVELQIDAYEEEAKLLPDIIETFTEFAHEDSLNQGFTREVERGTAQLNHQAKDVRERTRDNLMELEKEAFEVLSWHQQDLVSEDEPKPKPRRHQHRQREQQRRLEDAKEELQDLRQQIHPKVGELGRYLFHPVAGKALCQIAGMTPTETVSRAADVYWNGTEEYPIALVDGQKAEIGKLRGEINNWNLINGLHLDLEQIEQMVSLWDQARAEREKGLRKGGKARRLERELKVVLEHEFENALNDGQIEVLADYKACLLPPKNLKDPVRVGQANDNSGLARWLNRVRKAPLKRREKMIDNFLAKEAERFGELPPDELQKRRSLLLETVESAAGMSEVDFELNKEEMAEAIAPADRQRKLRQEIDDLSRERDLPGTVARFMLNQRFIDQLRIRGRQLAGDDLSEHPGLLEARKTDNRGKTCWERRWRWPRGR
jgi:hypothetical protein